MPIRVRCPKCQTQFAADPEAGPIVCPACGAKGSGRPAAPKPADAPKPAAAPPRPAADDSDDDEPTPRPEKKRKKRKKKAAKPGRSLWPVYAAGGVVLVALVAVGIFVLPGLFSARPRPPVVANPFAEPNPAPQPAPAPVPPPVRVEPEPPPLPWTAAADPPAGEPAPPAKDPKPDAKGEPKLVFVGRPVFASAGGPFVADIPNQFTLPLRVFDLRTGEYVGRIPKSPLKLPRMRAFGDTRLALAADGKAVIAQGQGQSLAVWKIDTDEPAATLPHSELVAFADFLADPNQVVTVAGAYQPVVRVWDVAKQQPRTAELPAARVGGPAPRTPPPIRAAVSPGRKFLAVSVGPQVSVVRLPEGKPAGVIRFRNDPEPVVCQGLRFSPDGRELVGAFELGAGNPESVSRLRGWSMADGKPIDDVELVELGHWEGVVVGPEKDAVILGPHAVDRKTGLALASYKFAPEAWLADGRLVGPVAWTPPKLPDPGPRLENFEESRRPPEAVRAGFAGEEENNQISEWWRKLRFQENTSAIAATPFDREGFARAAEEARKALAPRPPALPGDRSKAAVVSADPPAGWAVPADAAGKFDARTPAGVDPAAHAFALSGPAAARAAVLTGVYHNRPKARVALTLTWYDLKAGKPLGPTAELWPWVAGLVEHRGRGKGQPPAIPSLRGLGPNPLTAAVADPAGTRVALPDPGVPGRVDVWDDAGKRVLSLTAADRAVDWVGWSADGRLLTLANGALTGWDVPAGTAAFEVRGGYVGPAAPSPNRKWVVLPAKAHLDVIDAGSGKVLGRLDAGGAGGAWTGLAVSPDGTRLGGVRPERRRAVRTWDLTTGKPLDAFPVHFTAVGVPGGPGPLPTVHWHGPRQLLLGGVELVDLDARLVVARLDGLAHGLITGDSPDGRLWSMSMVGPQGGRTVAAAQLPAPGLALPEFVFGPTVGVAVEADCEGMTDRAKAALTENLTADGHRLAGGGWRVVASARVQAGREKMTFGPLDKSGVAIPYVNGMVKLIAPDGSVAWQGGADGEFGRTASKYYTRTKKEGTTFEWTKTEFYDFGGRNPRDAMAEEAWENFVKRLAGITIPQGLGREKGKVVPLPVAVRVGQ